MDFNMAPVVIGLCSVGLLLTVYLFVKLVVQIIAEQRARRRLIAKTRHAAK